MPNIGDQVFTPGPDGPIPCIVMRVIGDRFVASLGSLRSTYVIGTGSTVSPEPFYFPSIFRAECAITGAPWNMSADTEFNETWETFRLRS